MKCLSCGTDNEAGRKFCGECAAPLSAACPACGTPNSPTAKFCGECAAPLTSGRPAEAASTLAPTPVAERRLVSVLFADLVGFTPFAEERDAEDVRETLSRYFDTARAVVERYGGTVEKFIGDAVMAVWGTPVAREDDAERAVRAGLDLVESVPNLGPGITARVGILTGEAAVTLGATDQGMVAGDLVNTAARLQSVAPPGTVLVGESTRRASDASIQFEAAGDQELKGKTAPVPAFRAVRVLAQRGGHGRPDMPEPPFVGREEELRLLKELVALTGREPKTRLVSITGPGGIGKSRLAWELEKYLDGLVETVYWHRGRSPSYGEGVTFWALGEIVRRRLGLAEDDAETATREGVRAGVEQWLDDPDERRWVEPALLTLLGVEPPPEGGRDVLFAAWRTFFERIAGRGTLLLLFEDLQWADSGLLDFIDHLLQWTRGVPILIVTLARPELFDRRPTWGAGQRNFTSLDLEPLSSDAMQALLAGFVPGLPEAAIEAIVGRADGIPLYAVETARALLADGRLERTPHGYRPVGELGEIAVPDTLRSLIASRLDALAPEDRALLQDAAVLGLVFTRDSLAAVRRTPSALEDRLEGLVRRQLLELEVDPRSPERGQYRFVQSLIREVAYGTLARRERREKHLAVARQYEADGDDELAGALANHYLAAHAASAEGPEQDAVAVQARLALRAAAERAAQLGAHDQAVAYLREALGVTSAPADRAPLLERAAYSANLATRNAIAVDFAEEGLAAYRDAGDRAGVARIAPALGNALIDSGNPGLAVERLEAILDEIDPADEPGRAAVLTNLARAHYRNNSPADAVRVADAALPMAERHRLRRLIADGFQNKAAGLSYLGRVQEAIALTEAAIVIAEADGFADVELRARSNLTSIIWGDDVRRAYELSQRNLELARRIGNRLMTYWIVSAQAPAAFILGRDWDERMADVEETLEAGVEPAEEQHLRSFSAAIVAARLDGLDAMIERQEQLASEVASPTVSAQLAWDRAMRSIVTGHAADAVTPLLDAAQSDVPLASGYLSWAGHAAVWARDADLLRRVIARCEANQDPRADARDDLLAFRAALAGLEARRDEALAGYGEVIARRHEMGADFIAAWMALDQLIVLGPDVPEARAAALEWREVFERTRARAFIDRLDEAMDAPPPVPDAVRQTKAGVTTGG